MGKVILAGIAAGVALFIWGFVSHMFTPLGTMGVSTHPHEAMLLPAIQQTTTAPGFYVFPGMDMTKKPTKEEEAAWAERYRTGPHGVLILGANGRDAMDAPRLITELVTNLFTGILLAFLLGRLATGIGSFVSGGILAFLIGWTSISVPYWNWYSFPPTVTLVEMIDQVIGGAIVGLVVGLFLVSKKAS
ncbi:MAG TPA: hypothetical protein VFV33_03660 [Gemmatimonadaceae bacterium]|nr:hypothetical protein [Gemmatimonadaceae bacterium]